MRALLVIDDDEGARRTAELAGQVFDWNVVTAASRVELDRNVLVGWEPHLILMDYAMADRAALVQWINDHAWNQRTVLVTGGEEGTGIDAVAKQLSFAEGWAKPFPMIRLRAKMEAVATSAPTRVKSIGDRLNLVTAIVEKLKRSDPLKGSDPHLSFDSLVDHIEPAITILKVETRLIAKENAASKAQPLVSADWTRLFLLHAELEAAKTSGEDSVARADFVDWDEVRESWMHMRLYRVGEWFWLTRDWLSAGKGQAHAMADLASQDSLDKRLDALSKLLAERWGITRLRFYEVAQLPDDARADEPPQLWVIPRRQYGGGLEPNADTWMQEAFLYDANTNTPTDAEEEGWSVTSVSDPPNLGFGSPAGISVQGDGCQSIRWGHAKTRMQFLIWESATESEHGPATALLALDRRYDHIDSGESGSLGRSALLMMQDGRLKDLDSDEGKALAHGLLPAAAAHIRQSLEAEHLARKEDWNDILTRLVVTHIGGNRGVVTGSQEALQRRPAFASLSAIFAEMCEAWPRLWGASAANQKPTAWYIALKVSGNQWRTVAGVGDAHDSFKDADVLRQQWPFTVAFSKAEARAASPARAPSAPGAPQDNATVYQNFDVAWEAECRIDPGLAAPYGDSQGALAPVKSWAALPMQVDDKTWALMVVHWVVPNAVNEKQLRLLAHAARRLLPPLLVADSESRRREDWTGAVVHELKTDSLALTNWLKQVRVSEQPDSDEAMLMARHYAEGLLALAADYMTVMKSRSEHDDPPEKDDWDAALLRTLDPWMRTYKWDTTVWLNPSNRHPDPLKLPLSAHAPDPIWGTQTLSHAAHFRRVLRVLLHNAFRHGAGKVEIRTRLAVDARGHGVAFHLTVANSSAADAVVNLRANLDPNTSQIMATRVRRSLGLENAFRLSKAAGGCLGVRGRNGKGAVSTGVVARLRWPLAKPP